MSTKSARQRAMPKVGIADAYTMDIVEVRNGDAHGVHNVSNHNCDV